MKKAMFSIIAFVTIVSFIPTDIHGHAVDNELPWPTYQRDIYHTGYTPETGSPDVNVSDYRILWSYNTQKYIVASICVGDIDDDGEYEIIAATCGKIVSIENDGTLEWENEVGDYLEGISLGDVNNDGETEIVATSYNIWGGYNKAYVFKNNGEILWEHVPRKNFWEKQTGLVGFSTIADIDGKGKPEIIVGFGGTRGCESGLYCMQSSRSFFGIFWDLWGPPKAHQLWFFKTHFWTKMPAAVADLDGDGDKEIIFTSFDMRCYCLDTKGNKLWEFVTEGGPQDNPPKGHIGRAIDSAATIADLNGDGMYEILFTTDDEEYQSYIYALTADGEIFWKYPIKGSITSPCVADIDNDGKYEVIVGDISGNVHAFDSNGKEIWKSKVNGCIRSSSIADLNGDGYKEIIVGTVIMEGNGDGYVYILSHDGEILWQYHAGSKQMSDDIPVCDINNDGALEIIAGFEDGRVIAFSPFSAGIQPHRSIPAKNFSVKPLFLSFLFVLAAFGMKKR